MDHDDDDVFEQTMNSLGVQEKEQDDDDVFEQTMDLPGLQENEQEEDDVFERLMGLLGMPRVEVQSKCGRARLPPPVKPACADMVENHLWNHPAATVNPCAQRDGRPAGKTRKTCQKKDRARLKSIEEEARVVVSKTPGEAALEWPLDFPAACRPQHELMAGSKNWTLTSTNGAKIQVLFSKKAFYLGRSVLA